MQQPCAVAQCAVSGVGACSSSTARHRVPAAPAGATTAAEQMEAAQMEASNAQPTRPYNAKSHPSGLQGRVDRHIKRLAIACPADDGDIEVQTAPPDDEDDEVTSKAMDNKVCAAIATGNLELLRRYMVQLPAKTAVDREQSTRFVDGVIEMCAIMGRNDIFETLLPWMMEYLHWYDIMEPGLITPFCGEAMSDAYLRIAPAYVTVSWSYEMYARLRARSATAPSECKRRAILQEVAHSRRIKTVDDLKQLRRDLEAVTRPWHLVMTCGTYVNPEDRVLADEETFVRTTNLHEEQI